tara:strand:- start:8984 stop:11125 length:2142 start_codon:yes stop_codon:yes gene_type:complete
MIQDFQRNFKYVNFVIMGAAAVFYIDGPSFEEATTVFSDAALTTCAPNGFYQIGGIVREQVDCVAGLGGRLLPQTACPSCGAPPTTAPPVTTPPATTSPPITQPPPVTLYYKLLSCPTTQGSTLKYTAIPPDTSQFNQRYQDSQQDPPIFYIYDNSAGNPTPPAGTINNEIQIVPTQFGCPPPAVQYNYYNAVECNNVTAVVIRSAINTTLNSSEVVKTVGSSVCYSIQTVAAETTNFLEYDSSIPPFANCDACDPPVQDPNGFIISQSGQSDSEVQQDANNPRTEGQKVLTNINSNCWTLGTPIITSTGNTITSDCPPVSPCTLFIVQGGGSGGTISYTDCDGTNFNSQAIGINEETARCVVTGSITTTGTVTLDEQSPCDGTPSAPSDPYDYYNLRKCDGTGSTIVARYNGAAISNGQSVKISGICYQVISTSTDSSTTTDIVGNQIYTNCSICDPCAGVTTLSLSYNPNNNCTTSGSVNVRANGTTLLSASQIYNPTGACDSTNFAATGWYTQITATGSSSKFWNGAAFTQTITPCPTAPTEVTATLGEVINEIVGPTEGYTISGDAAGDTRTGAYGASTPFTFNTTVSANQGFSFTSPADVDNFSGTLTTSDVTGNTTITGTVAEDRPANFYQIRQCGTNTLYNIESGTPFSTNTVVVFRFDGGSGFPCGTIIGNAPIGATVAGSVMYQVPSCNSSQCTQGGSFPFSTF